MRSKNNINLKFLLLIISEYWSFLKEKIRVYFKKVELLYKDIKNKKYFILRSKDMQQIWKKGVS